MMIKLIKFKDQNMKTEVEVGLYKDGMRPVDSLGVNGMLQAYVGKRVCPYLSYELFDNGWYFYVAKDRGTIFS